MKAILTIAVVACSVMAVSGCGGGGSSAAGSLASAEEPGSILASGPTYKGEPHVRIPAGPPPKQLEFEDLKEGTGAEAKKGKWAEINFVAAGYKTKKKYETTWDNHELFLFPIEGELSVGALAKGVAGMRVGGRRVIVAPPQLVYGDEGAVFVVELMKVKSSSS